MYRNGHDSSHLRFVNPATGVEFGKVAVASLADVVDAVDDMRASAAIWRRKPPVERAQILKQLQKALVEHADQITWVINQDTGKSRQDALAELFLVVNKLNSYCKHAPRWLRPQRVPPGIYIFKRYHVEPRPYGVVGVLGPWNLPLDLLVSPVFAALLAGNTVVLKPSEVTPAVGALVEMIFQSIPELAPFVRVVHGAASVGEALVRARPDLIFLTGSTATGRRVARVAAETLTPVIAELGGNDPMIVLEDADVEKAARWGAWGAFFHSGQVCMGVERVYVAEAVYDDFVRAVLRETRRLKQGYSPDIANPNDIGPLTSDQPLEVIEAHLEDALEKGARMIAGGRRRGLFMEPTILVDVDHSMKLMREETFGPVMPIMKVKDEQEAIRLANDSNYGLSASVWSQDLQRARQVADALEVGSVVVNDTIAHYAVSLLPFGGVKQSGNARTHGRQDVLQFTQLKAYGIGGTPFPLDVAARLRQPDQYRLMSALLHLLFGVTPRQRARAAGQATRFMAERVAPARSRPGLLRRFRRAGRGGGQPAARAVGVAAGLAALAAVWLGRKQDRRSRSLSR